MRNPRLTPVVALVALAIGLTSTPAANARTFNVPCDAFALLGLVATINTNLEEDVVWLAPSCVYSLYDSWIVSPDGGFPLTVHGNGATLSGKDERRAFIVNAGATVYLNSLTATRGATTVDGGAIFNAGALTVTRSTVSDSQAATGGGIFNAENAQLTLIHSTVSGNVANEDGGGIRNRRGRLTLIGSTVSGNEARGQSGRGGGIFNDRYGTGVRSTTTLTNSTISGNSSRFGAGVMNDEAVLVVSHCTFSDNNEWEGGNGGGIYHRNYFGGGVVRLGNSIVANSQGDGYDCVRDPYLPSNLITPSAAGNLVEDGSCDVSGALSGDPMLGSLTGSPGYHPLLPGSPAIDTIGSGFCTGVDQRGAPRPQDGDGNGSDVCDLGAHEAP